MGNKGFHGFSGINKKIIQRIVGAMFTGNTETGITAEYQDSDGKIDLTALRLQVNNNDIFRCDAPGGASLFTGTIATLPGGAVLTYNVTTGAEGAMVPTSTAQLGKMRLYNTTRGTNALISNCVVGTNTIIFTANVPVGWVVTDVITIVSQTVSGGSTNWVDIEITDSSILNKSALYIRMSIENTTIANFVRTHPTETYSASKIIGITAQVTNLSNSQSFYLKMESNLFSFAWSATTNPPTTVFVRLGGYLP